MCNVRPLTVIYTVGVNNNDNNNNSNSNSSGSILPRVLLKKQKKIIIYTFLICHEVVTLEAATVTDIEDAVEPSCLFENQSRSMFFINFDRLFRTSIQELNRGHCNQ